MGMQQRCDANTATNIPADKAHKRVAHILNLSEYEFYETSQQVNIGNKWAGVNGAANSFCKFPTNLKFLAAMGNKSEASEIDCPSAIRMGHPVSKAEPYKLAVKVEIILALWSLCL